MAVTPPRFAAAVALSLASQSAEPERREAPVATSPLAKHRLAAEEAYGPGLWGIYQYQDDRLATKGLHRTSPWWAHTFAGFFAARATIPTLTWILALCGRGSGKSTTLERLAMVVTFFAARTMSPAEAWQWPFISVLKEDAERRIFEIEKLVRLAYSIEVKALRGQLKIETEDAAGNAVEFLSMASTIGNVSGPSTMGATVDEAAKMRSAGVNPDVELIVSLAATSRARDNWIGVRCSSAWETRGAHHAAIMGGSNEVNYVATIGVEFIDAALEGFAEVAAWEAAQGNEKGARQIRAWARTLTAHSPNVPTWVCNPTIPALKSRVLLKTVPRDAADEDIDETSYWLREYGSMPLARDGGANAIEQCLLARDYTRHVNDRLAGRVKPKDPNFVEPMKLRGPGVRENDARYAGPEGGPRAKPARWNQRRPF